LKIHFVEIDLHGVSKNQVLDYFKFSLIILQIATKQTAKSNELILQSRMF